MNGNVMSIVGRTSICLWQADDEGIPEPAIAVTNYEGSGMIELMQGNHIINVNYEAIDHLCRVMKNVKTLKNS